MDEMMVFDAFAWGALGIYLLVLGAVAGVSAFLSSRRGAGAWTRLRDQLGQPGLGRATFAPLPRGDFLVWGADRAAMRASTGAVDRISRLALVKDADGQTGLVVTVGGENLCLTGIGPMARIWSQAQRDGAEAAIVFRSDESERMNRLVGSLGAKERELLSQWLTEKEVLTDIIDGVDYTGRLRSTGSRGAARLLVTNLRVGLLATTVTTQQSGNVRHSTTHFHLISYLLPLAKRVTIRRTASLRRPRYRLELELAPEHQQQDTPTLLLTEDHAGIFLPLVLFRCPLDVVEAPVGVGSVIRGTLAGLGWAILGAGVGAVVSAVLSEGLRNGHWYYRYSLPIVLGAALTPLVLRAVSLGLEYLERARSQRLHAALAAG